MKAPRDILKHVSIEVAKAKRKCYRTGKHTIVKGEVCIVIQEGNFGGSKNYCISCAREILEAAGTKLDSLHAGLGSISER